MFNGVRRWFHGHRVLVLVVSFVFELALVAYMQDQADGVSIIDLELAGSVANAVVVLGGSDSVGIERGLYADFAYILAYGAFLLAAVWLARNGHRRRGWGQLGRYVMFGVLAAMALDAMENVLLLWALPIGPDAGNALFAFAAILAVWKFVLVFVAITYCVARAVDFVIGKWTTSHRHGRFTVTPQILPEPVPSLDPSAGEPATPDFAGWPTGAWDPQPGKIGIACSGGGVRSAAYNLGALQSLEQAGELGRARYLSAVSGGAYIASAMTIARNRAPDGEPTEARFAPGSPEERYLRNHSSYIAPNAGGQIAALGALLLGLALQLVLIWLILFIAARPIGWTVSYLHPELRSRLPIVSVEDQPRLWIPGLGAEVTTDAQQADGVRRFDVEFGEKRSLAVDADGTDRIPIRPGPRVLTYPEDFDPGTPVVQLKDDQWSVVVQPTATVHDIRLAACAPPPASCPTLEDPPAAVRDPKRTNRNHQPYLRVVQQPVVGLVEGSQTDATVPGTDDPAPRFVLQRQPRVAAFAGLEERPGVAVRPWMWWVSLAPLAIALLLGLLRRLRRSVNPPHGFWRSIPVLLVASGVLLSLLIGLPWLMVELPTLWSDPTTLVPGNGTPTGGAFVPLASFVSLAWVAVRTFVSKNAPRVATVVAAVVLPVAALLAFTGFLRLAAANGPTGHLAGFGLGWWGGPDWFKAALAFVVLGSFWLVADASSWSLHPFYKRRLASAYTLEREGEGAGVHADAIAYSDRLRLDEYARGRDTGDDRWPDLVICAAANISDEGATPKGRAAESFTFSATEIGGPRVGWVDTTELEDAMAFNRSKDTTITSAVAMSGAAVSPAMGKATRGLLSPLLAVLNVRLGVWFPHPGRVRELVADNQERPADAQEHWRDRPRVSHLLREVVSLYHRDHRYLYVTDGGHWENLGLVELLRRGCTEIYCFDASGDHVDSFFTIGEAIALARTELGVEIDIDPSTMRPAPAAETSPGRIRAMFRRKDGSQVVMAPADHVVGTFTYPHEPDEEPVTGILVIAKTAVTEGVPWDVMAYAEKRADFPTHSTIDQLYTDEKFEAYRALGHYTAGRAEAAMAKARKPPDPSLLRQVLDGLS